MALIKCIECGGPVSAAATTCPKCGAPVSSIISTDAASATLYTPFWIPARITGVIFIFLAIGTSVLFFINKDSLLGGGSSVQMDMRVLSLAPAFLANLISTYRRHISLCRSSALLYPYRAHNIFHLIASLRSSRMDPVCHPTLKSESCQTTIYCLEPRLTRCSNRPSCPRFATIKRRLNLGVGHHKMYPFLFSVLLCVANGK